MIILHDVNGGSGAYRVKCVEQLIVTPAPLVHEDTLVDYDIEPATSDEHWLVHVETSDGLSFFWTTKECAEKAFAVFTAPVGAIKVPAPAEPIFVAAGTVRHDEPRYWPAPGRHVAIVLASPDDPRRVYP